MFISTKKFACLSTQKFTPYVCLFIFLPLIDFLIAFITAMFFMSQLLGYVVNDLKLDNLLAQPSLCTVALCGIGLGYL